LTENTSLAVDKLRRIWDLVELDGDGTLDEEEFAVAM